MPRSVEDFYKPGKYTDLNLTDDSLLDVSEYIDTDALERETFKVSDAFNEEYSGMDTNLIKNIEINTRVKEEMVGTSYNLQDAIELEDYRMFPRGFMARRGVFYCSNIANIIPDFELLKYTDIYQITNDTYEERYMLPICLPNGHVFTHMGYCPPIADPNAFKYIMGNIDRVDQGNLIGHMESLAMYPNVKTIYVCEGMMDAYRLSDIFQSPALALLGANLTLTKQSILKMLVDNGYTLIYVPDMDNAGLNEKILGNKLFSNIISFNSESKDIDIMVKVRYIDYIAKHYHELNTELEVEKVPTAYIPEGARLEINEGVKADLKYQYSYKIFTGCSSFIFNQYMQTFSSKNEG